MRLQTWLAAVLVALLPAVALAQTDQGKLTGTVRDQSNAFVAGAKVTVKNERTGEERSAVTNEQGLFLISFLKPSTYTIRVERAGFAPIEYTQMPLAVGQELTLDFELKPAGVQEAVTVVGSAPVIDLSSAKIGVNLIVKPSERDTMRNHVFAGDAILSVWTGLENGLPTPDMSPQDLAPTSQQQLQWPMWGEYVETKGAAGKKAPHGKGVAGLTDDQAKAVATYVKGLK